MPGWRSLGVGVGGLASIGGVALVGLVGSDDVLDGVGVVWVSVGPVSVAADVKGASETF